MKLSILLSLIVLCISTQLIAQEEFIIGKSANSLNKGSAIISGEYTAYAFDNIKSRRAGLDIAYGVSERFSLFLRGSLSDFQTADTEFETGTLTVLYRILDINVDGKEWAVATFAQASVVSRTAQIAGDINFEGNNSGFSLGLVVNRNLETLTLAATAAYAKINLPRFVDGLLDGYGVLYQVSANKRLDIFPNQRGFDFNLIAEFIGQYNTEISSDQGAFFDSGSYLDGLGGLQFTISNTYRVELAVQTQLTGSIPRFTDSLYHIRLKYML